LRLHDGGKCCDIPRLEPSFAKWRWLDVVVILHCNQYCDTNLLDEKNHCNCVLIWRIAARTYLPFMAANAAHLSANSEDNDMFSVTFLTVTLFTANARQATGPSAGSG